MLARVLTPELIDATTRQYAALHPVAPPADVSVTSDERYGPHERQRLDVFRPRLGARLPVLLFVHGGGFAGGDKALPGTPFHGNVGIWAARHGLLGVVMTYRLAPGHPWPAGAEDVGAAVRWVRDEGLHATVKFLGGVPETLLPDLRAAVTDAVGHIVRQTKEEPPTFLVRLLFSFKGVSEVEVPADRIHAA